MLDLSPSRVRTWVAVDTLSHRRTNGGVITIPLREVLALRTARNARARCAPAAAGSHLRLVVNNP